MRKMRNMPKNIPKSDHELLLRIDEIMGLKPIKLEERPLHVSISYAAYGSPTMAVLEWNGTPPHNSTVVNLYGGSPVCLYCNGTQIRQHHGLKVGTKDAVIGELVYAFLVERGHIEE